MKSLALSFTDTLPLPRDLEGTTLFAPSLHPTPLPIRKVSGAPCTQACPAGINVKAYVSLIAEGKFAEALEVVRQQCPLPGVCGRICHHPCEDDCRRKDTDDPVSIRALKRFVADMEPNLPWPEPPPKPRRGRKVAVIGSGPAGLTAAYDLRMAGYPVTIFEAEAAPGGMLRHGIAEYRLPRDILAREIEVFRRAGIKFRTGVRLGKDFDLEKLFSKGFKAVLLAVGAQAGRQLGIPGEERTKQISDALTFLREVNNGDRTTPGQKVLVIGGGSTAIEAARAARRLGADKVEILYRRSPQEVLASSEEVEAAEAEGVRFRFLTAPSRVLTKGKRLVGLECLQVALGEEDRSGRRRPIPIPGSEFTVDADRVLAAVGQQVDLGFLPSQARMESMKGKQLAVDPQSLETKLARVFAAGDMVTGPSTVVHAIAAGHRASDSIRRFLEKGEKDSTLRAPAPAPPEYELPDITPLPTERLHPKSRIPSPGREFDEVEAVFTREEAMAEAARCLRCGGCSECRLCASSCQRRHISLRARGQMMPGSAALLRAPAGMALAIQAGRPVTGWVLPPGASPKKEGDSFQGFEVELFPVRSEIETDRCRGCANCAEVCPFDAITMATPEGSSADKAHIEPYLCRGCTLCSGVCPTRAALPAVFAPAWWGRGLEDAVPPEVNQGTVPRPYVVLACPRRADLVASRLAPEESRVEVVRLRCVGHIEAGMLVDLLNRGAQRVLVAGCEESRCRFDKGTELAMEQVSIARGMLPLLGMDPERIVTDWAADGLGDELDGPVIQLVDQRDVDRNIPPLNS